MSTSSSPARSLEAANARAHLHLEEAWLDLMEALIEPDFEGARAALSRLKERVLAHAALEDRLALPAYRALDETERFGRTDDHIEGDHKILDRVLSNAERQLDALALQGAERRQVLSVLEPFVRVQSVLEHHTAREQERFYPALDRASAAILSQDAREELRCGLLRTAGADANSMQTEA